MQLRDLPRRAARYVWQAGCPPGPASPGSDWAAWTLRLVLIGVLLAWSFPAIIRPNIPLLFPSYRAFDDSVPFSWWGYGGLSCALLLWLLPPRFPAGLLSTGLAMFYLYLVGAMFQASAGLLNGSVMFRAFGLVAGALFMRALWLWAERQTWFRERVMKVSDGR